jgi:acetaldehyde dehydrogenase (acetylating)
MGHTMAIHSKNEEVILQFGLRKPAFRICVNTPTTHGSIGLTTGLDPAMTLGCGGWGGNITSDNISPRHLLNIKRLAYEVRPAAPSATMSAMAGTPSRQEPEARPVGASPARLPRTRAVPPPRGISASTLAARIDSFLASRGYRPPDGAPPVATEAGERDPSPPPARERPAPAGPAEFICEDDVRAAVRAGRKLLVGERTIITPAARDLGDAEHVFVQAGWPH